jgi:hypothetical protein
MDNVQEPEEVNDTCVKTMHLGTIDRGFTVHYKISNIRISKRTQST